MMSGTPVPHTSIPATHRGAGSVASADVPMSSAGPNRGRYGSPERGGPRPRAISARGARERERDRDYRVRGDASPHLPQFVRFNAVGPQETMDWLEALEKVNNRMDTIDRVHTLNSKSIADQHKELQKHYSIMRELDRDITEYKKYVDGRFNNMEKVTSEEIKKINEMLHLHTAHNMDVNDKNWNTGCTDCRIA